MRELVDDDRLEGIRRGQDESPRERQPTFARRTAPSGPLVTDADRRRETWRASAWRRISRSIAARARGLNQPSSSTATDRRSGAARVDHDLVLVGTADPLDPRATDGRRRMHDPQPVEIAAEPDRGAIPQAAACL
jgi:hypothetical protein